MKNIYKDIEDKLLKSKARDCDKIAQAASDIAGDHCEHFVNEMKCEDKEHPCPCSGGGAGGSGSESSEVDLIILCDATGSMSASMRLIAASLKKAIALAKESCKKDADPPLLYVDQIDGSVGQGAAPNEPAFSMSHEKFLRAVDGYAGSFRTEVSDGLFTQPGEEGAEAIVDLCQHHKWKEGACRAILYISDSYLDSDSDRPTALARSAARMNEAVQAANQKNVTLFTHFLPRQGNAEVDAADYAALETQYKNLASQTNGASITNQPPSAALYEELITKAICQSCANRGGCAEVKWPEISPCVHVSWGASKCDGIESHDDEVVCISLCNCYTNVTFKNVRIGYVIITDEKGNLPPLLPDGSPSAHIYPTGPVCFGDIEPCEKDEETCVSRQFVVLTRGALEGKYKVKIGGLCFETHQHHHIRSTECEFKICKD